MLRPSFRSFADTFGRVHGCKTVLSDSADVEQLETGEEEC